MAQKVPEFNTEEEEARFWDEHDSTEFINEFKLVEIELSPELEDEILSNREQPVALRLEPSQIDAVKKLLQKRDCRIRL